jgi:XTP/dITP diphosphohydrolase
VKLVLASNNAKKLIELQALLGDSNVELVAQGELGVAEADEPYSTFVENALAKARHAAQVTGLPAIADDSGLCVDALGGAPGVASAVYAPTAALQGGREAQRRAQDAANNQRLLQRMHGAAERGCHFVCTLVALRSAADPQPLIATGRWGARLLDGARGEGGFGYDPLAAWSRTTLGGLPSPQLGRTRRRLDQDRSCRRPGSCPRPFPASRPPSR